jgi:hypothetical protein
MRYKLDFSEKLDVSAPSVSGAMVGSWKPDHFVAWVPSTWPPAPNAVDQKFIENLKRIFEESILAEVRNVIEDVQKSRKDLQHRGHVIAIGLLCALDAIASYGYRGHHVAEFITAHFRDDYKPFADDIYELHRCNLVHSWNLFEAAIYPDYTKITLEAGVLGFGLLDFFDVLVAATEDFLNKLDVDRTVQGNTLERYAGLQATAKG